MCRIGNNAREFISFLIFAATALCAFSAQAAGTNHVASLGFAGIKIGDRLETVMSSHSLTNAVDVWAGPPLGDRYRVVGENGVVKVGEWHGGDVMLKVHLVADSSGKIVYMLGEGSDVRAQEYYESLFKTALEPLGVLPEESGESGDCWLQTEKSWLYGGVRYSIASVMDKAWAISFAVESPNENTKKDENQ